MPMHLQYSAIIVPRIGPLLKNFIFFVRQVGVRALRADLLTSVHQSVHQKLLVYLVPPTVPTLCH